MSETKTIDFRSAIQRAYDNFLKFLEEKLPGVRTTTYVTLARQYYPDAHSVFIMLAEDIVKYADTPDMYMSDKLSSIGYSMDQVDEETQKEMLGYFMFFLEMLHLAQEIVSKQPPPLTESSSCPSTT
jgi:hypothetical protein